MAMYEELLFQGASEPDLMENIAAQVHALQLGGAAAATVAYGGGRCGSAGAASRPGPTELAADMRCVELPQHAMVDSPPGPGPGSGAGWGLGPGPGPGSWEAAALARQVGTWLRAPSCAVLERDAASHTVVILSG